MISFFFAIVFFCLGWYLRGTRFAKWVYKWFEPDPDGVK